MQGFPLKREAHFSYYYAWSVPVYPVAVHDLLQGNRSLRHTARRANAVRFPVSGPLSRQFCQDPRRYSVGKVLFCQ